ncbi:phosphopantetheine-binding protein [Streptomyces sp. NPDC006261]|uniref:phosphopantetheine-binding protein n=1 Tax=Streptomyces sp. NPDC006261 TaxID=3156739 RepID=UPI0033AAD99A
MSERKEISADLLNLLRGHLVSQSLVTELGDVRFEEDLGMDSMKIVELLEEVEEHFEFAIPDEDLARLHTVRDLQAVIEKNNNTLA